MAVATTKTGLATKFLQNMREQAHKAGYKIEEDLKAFRFHVSTGLLSLESLKTSEEELDKLVATNKAARGIK